MDLSERLKRAEARAEKACERIRVLEEALRMADDFTGDEEDENAVSVAEFEERYGKDAWKASIFKARLRAALAPEEPKP